MSVAFADSIQVISRSQRQQRWLLGFGAALAAVVITTLAASLDSTAGLALAIAIAGLMVPVIAWRLPQSALVVFIGACALVEQYPIVGDGTDRIPFFVSLSSLGLSGLYMTPAEIILGIFLLVWVLKAGVEGRLRFPSSPMSAALGLFMAIILLAEVRGLSGAGQFNIALDELRPWLYLALFYALASQLVGRPDQIKFILWPFVLGTGLKGLQGSYEFLRLRNVVPRPESILAHEEAFFFGLFTLLVIALWLFGEKGRLRLWATLLLPGVIIADLGNSRRTSWPILLAGVAILFLMTWMRFPARRYVVRRMTLALLACALTYFPLFWNSQGALGQPARAVRSILAPSPRDQLSDQYRVLENANLTLNIKRAAVFGQGFGVPIDYAIRLPDLSSVTSMIKFVPHNGILYVWMRLGTVGALAFWWLIAAAFIVACRVARHPDRSIALLGALAISSLVAYLIQGYYDLGLYWFRIAIFMGCILGAAQAMSAFQSHAAIKRG